MDMQLLPLAAQDKSQFMADMQEAFQKGAEAAGEAAPGEEPVLPASDIEASLAKPGAVALKAMLDGRLAGGAVVVLEAPRGHLDFLYVRHGEQSRGLGQAIWRAIEQRFPHIQVWETATPWFEKRNLHFYINQCGFAAVEFFCPHHPDHSSGRPDEMEFFRFEKRMDSKS